MFGEFAYNSHPRVARNFWYHSVYWNTHELHIIYLPSFRINIRLCDPFRVNERAHQLQLLLLDPLDILYQISASRSMHIRPRRRFTVSIEFGTM
jgi:hypothetical protein